MPCYEIIKNDNVDLNSSIHTAGNDRLCLEMLQNSMYRMTLLM